MRMLKAAGVSDQRLASLTGGDAEKVRMARHALDVVPVYKRIDTCAAEFASPTAYMYSTYEVPFDGSLRSEADVSDRKKIVILGGGPNRIGQGIEFDYCCCHAAFALRDAGFEAIMVNCNPETVSTDYDTSDRLYFEPLTAEDVLEILAYCLAVYGKPLPNALKKGLGQSLARCDAYQLAKYRKATAELKLVDAVNLVHPPHTDALRDLVAGTLAPAETWETKLTQAGQESKSDREKDVRKAAAWATLIRDR